MQCSEMGKKRGFNVNLIGFVVELMSFEAFGGFLKKFGLGAPCVPHGTKQAPFPSCGFLNNTKNNEILGKHPKFTSRGVRKWGGGEEELG